MNLRRAGIVSLMLAVMALAGASVAPTRGADGRFTSAIVWQARENRRAPVVRTCSQTTATNAARTAIAAPRDIHGGYAPVRHALFQRPPPAFSSTL